MLCSLATLTLAACGGGGGGGGGTSGGGGGPPPSYSVGGTITGLSASGLVLQDNGGDNLSPASGATTFTFSTMLASGAAYAVTVMTQPAGETCTVTSGSGTVSANVSTVAISCTVNTYSIGGSITGLNASGLVLQDNGGDNLTVNSGNTSFTFATKLDAGAAYSVSVLTQPTGETCLVSSGSGTASANVTSVALSCGSSLNSISGSVTGLTSAGLKLNFYAAGTPLSVPGTASGSTTYTYPNVPFNTTVQMVFTAQPGWATCSANSGDFSGNITQNVTGENVSCTADTATASALQITGATLLDPEDVAVDSHGNLFLSDYGANKIYEISGGTATQLATSYTFDHPFGIAVDSSGNVYVANTGASQILEIVASGGVVSASSAVQQLARSTTFGLPDGVAVDAHGDVFVADTGDNEIDEIAPGAATATVLAGSTQAGCVNGNGTSAEFNQPTDLALDAAGNLYVTDWNNNVIREITSVGTTNTVTVLAGGGSGYACAGSATGARGYMNGTGSAAEFNQPIGVTVDASGNVFVVDNGNNAVREVTPQGVVTTLAGATNPSNGTTTIYGFSSPWGITEDASSNLYVGDTTNAKVVKLAP